jgi:RecA-family ATPase
MGENIEDFFEEAKRQVEAEEEAKKQRASMNSSMPKVETSNDPYFNRWLGWKLENAQKTIQNAVVGHRHEARVAGARVLGGLIPNGYITEDYAQCLGEEWALTNTDTPHAIAKDIRDGVKNGMKSPIPYTFKPEVREDPDYDPKGGPEPEDNNNNNKEEPKLKIDETEFSFKTTNWSCERFIDNPQPIKTIIDNVMPAGVVGLFYSMGGLGKSTLFLNLCIKMALANIHKVDFFGNNISGGDVALVSAEDPNDVVNIRLVEIKKAIANEYNLEPVLVKQEFIKHFHLSLTFGHCVHFFNLSKDGKLEKTHHFDELVEVLSARDNLQLIGIDTKARFSDGEGAGNPIATREMQFYEELSLKTGASVMLLHHTNKASRNGQVNGAQAYRDASALFDSARFCCYFRPALPDEIPEGEDVKSYLVIENTKNNYLPILEDQLIKRTGYDFKKCDKAPKMSNERKESVKGEKDLNKLISLLQLDDREEWTGKQIIAIAAGECIGKNAVYDILERASLRGYVNINRAERNGLPNKYSLTEQGSSLNNVMF